MACLAGELSLFMGSYRSRKVDLSCGVFLPAILVILSIPMESVRLMVALSPSIQYISTIDTVLMYNFLVQYWQDA